VWDVRPHIKGALIPALNQKTRQAKKEQLEQLGYDDSYINDAVDTKVIWSMEAIQVLRPGTIKEPTVQLVSVGALVTGEHYDLVILDDVVDMQNSNTPTKAEIVVDWTRDLESVLDPSREVRIAFPENSKRTMVDWVGEEIVTVGTPYFTHDLYSYLEANAEGMGLEVFKKNIYVNGEDAKDGYNWESRLGEEQVNRRKARLNSNQLFSSQYLLQVIDREVTGFNTTGAEYFGEPDYLDDGKVRVKHPSSGEYHDILPILVLDPAATTSATSDFSVIAVGGSDRYGNLYVLEAQHLRESFTKVVDVIFDYIKKYSLRTVRIEAVGGFAALPDLFRERAAARGIRSGVIPFVPSGGKQDRISVKLQPLFDSNSIFFHRKLATNKEMHLQLKHFPVHAHDDYPDALSMLAQFAFKTRDQTNHHRNKFEVNRKYGGLR
jgi:predicted phage terminase large subunit-like protein